MTPKVKLAIVAAALAAAIGPAAFAAPARPASTAVDRTAAAVQPAVPKGTVHKPVGTVEAATTNSGIALSAGFTDSDSPQRINCASNNGCTIIISTFANVLTAEAGDGWAICALVDGTMVDACNLQGVTSNTAYTAGNNRQSIAVAKGNHTVHTQIYLGSGTGTLGGYHYDYEITTP